MKLQQEMSALAQLDIIKALVISRADCEIVITVGHIRRLAPRTRI